jgi:hypothetical protein
MIPERQPEGPYFSFVSNASGRHATLEDDGYSAWLYLTSQSKHEVIATAFVYSRVELPEFRVAPLGKSGPPLLLRQFATSVAVQRSVAAEDLRIKFSADGNSAIVFLRGEPWTLVLYDQEHGYSKSLSVAGPFGNPWDEQIYHEHFNNTQFDQ